MNKDNDIESRIQLAGQMLKATLEQTNLYIAIDADTEEFIFIDRTSYAKGINIKTGRVHMKQINVRD